MNRLAFSCLLFFLLSCNNDKDLLTKIPYEQTFSHDNFIRIAESTKIIPLNADSVHAQLSKIKIDRLNYEDLGDTNYVIGQLERNKLHKTLGYSILLVKSKHSGNYQFILTVDKNSTLTAGILFAAWDKKKNFMRQGQLTKDLKINITDLVSEVELSKSYAIDKNGMINPR